MEFIAGFFDTDGAIDRKARTIKFTQKSEEVLIQIKQELADVHVGSSLYFDKRWAGWELHILKRDKKKFFALIHPRVKRKKLILDSISGPVVQFG